MFFQQRVDWVSVSTTAAPISSTVTPALPDSINKLSRSISDDKTSSLASNTVPEGKHIETNLLNSMNNKTLSGVVKEIGQTVQPEIKSNGSSKMQHPESNKPESLVEKKM